MKMASSARRHVSSRAGHEAASRFREFGQEGRSRQPPLAHHALAAIDRHNDSPQRPALPAAFLES